MFVSYLLKNWKTILVAGVIILVGLYIFNLKDTISDLEKDVAFYKSELQKESDEVLRLSKVNLDNISAMQKIKEDANKSVRLCRSQYNVSKSKETELLNLIESLKSKVKSKPKVKTVFKLKECKVTVSSEDPNDPLLNNLNRQIGGL